MERVAQLLMVRERKRSKRPFLAEHGVNEESLSRILDNDGGISDLLNFHNLNFFISNYDAKVALDVKFIYTISFSSCAILIIPRKNAPLHKKAY